MLNYFGSAYKKLNEKDFNRVEQRDFTIRKKVLWESSEASDKEINQIEVESIRLFEFNNPIVGYNQCPKFKV